MGLWDIFLSNDDRVIHKWTHYFPVYEKHFNRFVNNPILFIEIGCGCGGSLQMWKKYFGPFAQIVGVDINPICKDFEEEQIDVRIGDQNDSKFLLSLIEEFGKPDIVLDDGSHIMEHVKNSFFTLYPLVNKSGVYMVEDMHTSYWEEYGGGIKREGSFIEISKSLIDELNADHNRMNQEKTEFRKNTLSIHFYDSIVVFERGQYLRKYAPMIGGKR